MPHVNSGYKTNPSLIFSIFSHPMVPLKLESQAFGNLNFSFWGPLSRPSSSHLTAPDLRHPPPHALWQLAVNNNNSFLFSFSQSQLGMRKAPPVLLHICSHYTPPDRPHPCLQWLHHYSPINWTVCLYNLFCPCEYFHLQHFFWNASPPQAMEILPTPNRQVKFNYSSKFLLWIPKVFDSFVISICFFVIVQVGMDMSDTQVFINPKVFNSI